MAAETKVKKTKKREYTYAVGRRRSSIARVRLFKGKGESTVNSKKIADYFSDLLNREDWTKPFKLSETTGKYYITVRVVGGGRTGQLGAVIHGVARALALVDSAKYRKLLKPAGLLTRDSRTRERRKVNTGGKARRQKQSPKR